MSDFNNTLTEAQACDVVYRGVIREVKQDSQRTRVSSSQSWPRRC